MVKTCVGMRLIAAAALLRCSASLLAPPALRREFRFVPYGSVHKDPRPAISADGKVPCSGGGAVLELTHWNGNETPTELYADTSTECAINLANARLRGEFAAFDDALVVNNHYDTDGVLSVFACLHPEVALKHAELLAAGAAAGDFGEWSSGSGIRLDAAIEFISTTTADEAAAYIAAMDVLPAMLRDFEETGGSASEGLWGKEWEAVCESWAAVEAGHATLTLEGTVATVLEPHGGRLAAAAVHRALDSHSAGGAGCTRVLRVTEEKGRYRYELEKPGHGWVKRLVTRRPIPDANGADLAKALKRALPGTSWAKGGQGGLVSICKSDWTANPPPAVLDALRACDASAA